MRMKFTYSILATLALATGWVQADKITLKDGTVLEGEVVSETDTEYVIAVAFSKSIRTRKTYKKSEIALIEKEAPDLKPFEELKGILPTPDQLSVTDYEQLIEARVKPFLTKFPKSTHAKDVQKMLETLEGELAKAKAGEIKMDGEWITAEEWNKDAIELDAQLLVKKMKAYAARGAYRPALLLYDKVNKEFKGSDAANEAAEIAGNFLPKYGAQINKLAEEADDKLKKRNTTLESMNARDATRMRKAYADDEARHNAAVEAARDARVKWLPVNEYNSRDLKTLARSIEQEISSIQRESSKVRGDSTGEIYRQGWEAASKGDATGVRRAQTTLRARRVDDKYLALLDTHLAANPAPEKPKGPTAAELKAAADKKAAEEAAAKAEEEKKKAEEEKERRRKEREAAAAEDNDEPEEESGSSILPVIIGVVLLGVLLTFLVIQRKQGEE